MVLDLVSADNIASMGSMNDDATAIENPLTPVINKTTTPFSLLSWKAGVDVPPFTRDNQVVVSLLAGLAAGEADPQASRRNSRRSAHSSQTRVRGCARCALAARCRLEPPNDSVPWLLPAAPCSVRLEEAFASAHS